MSIVTMTEEYISLSGIIERRRYFYIDTGHGHRWTTEIWEATPYTETSALGVCVALQTHSPDITPAIERLDD